MTPAQHRKYLREWGLCRRVFRKQGLEPPACDAKRHELHKRALGHDKSSLDLTNAEFDEILAVFSSISRPADLKTQLRLQEQAPEREAMRTKRITDLLEILDVDIEGRTEYLDELCRRICGRPWNRLGETEKEKIAGVLADRSRRHKQKMASTDEANGDPF